MFFALDENNNRVNAEDGEFANCVCPACKNPVRQRRGDTNRHHFAHIRKDLSCPFEYNKDYINMSEWHRRMQNYFPKENRERIFVDKKTGEKHIADVYLDESNTVLEFQYSSLRQQEFLDRTRFHLGEGRRMVWLFYESSKNTDEEKTNYKNGKLVKAHNSFAQGPYKDKSFKWLYRRKYVEEGPPVYQADYSICLYTGVEGDVFHRVISLDKSKVILSLHDIEMSDKINTEDFFAIETVWQEQEPWKSDFERLKSLHLFDRFYPSQITKETEEPDRAFDGTIAGTAEAIKRHKEAKRKEWAKQIRDDYMDGLVDSFDEIELQKRNKNGK